MPIAHSDKNAEFTKASAILVTGESYEALANTNTVKEPKSQTPQAKSIPIIGKDLPTIGDSMKTCRWQLKNRKHQPIFG